MASNAAPDPLDRDQPFGEEPQSALPEPVRTPPSTPPSMLPVDVPADRDVPEGATQVESFGVGGLHARKSVFAAVTSDGREVALRWPDPGELLCDECATYMLATSAGHTYVGGGPQAGHACEDEFTAPLWLVRDSSCRALDDPTHLPGTTLAAHLEIPGGQKCECGTVDLYTALSLLDASKRQAAIDAHTQLICALYDHLLACEAVTAGVDLDDDTQAGPAAGTQSSRGAAGSANSASASGDARSNESADSAHVAGGPGRPAAGGGPEGDEVAEADMGWLDGVCPACLTDPDHVDALDGDLLAATSHLALVLRAYGARITLPTSLPTSLPADGHA